MDEVSTTTSKEGEPRLPWSPSQQTFSPYSPPPSETAEKSSTLRVVVRRPLVARLTKDIVQTYQICNPQFKYSEELNPKRFLTSPSIGVLNEGYDNANSDLILAVNFVLVNLDSQRRYVVKDVLGHGTFGQVAKCWVSETNSFVAVKIIKNQPAYYQQARVEVYILTTLNKKFDPEDKHHIVRILDYFVYQHHLCISFELLGTNLYELLKINNFKGLSLSIVQLFSKQILHALVLMKDAGIIHCDMKPENILLSASVKPAEIKIIDFGSACMEDKTVYSYIQSRYYRSPEVLLGSQYTTAIDMWSFGCIVAELFLGLPLFPGASEFDLLRRMIKILGGQPPDHVLKEAKNTSKFFKRIGSIHLVENSETSMGGRSAFQALTEVEYEARELKKPLIGKEYFKNLNLEQIVTSYPYRRTLPDEEFVRENQIRLALIDFLRGLVEFDPAKRWSPLQASRHPFVTGEPFTSPYKPALETPRMPVAQNVKVDHHPGGGHWFAAGLSPQVSNMNRGPPQNTSHFQVAPYSHASSYGSLGSHGSYNDSAGLGSSYGSHGDNSSMYIHYSPVGPSGFNILAHGGVSILGASPDARRTSQLTHGNGLGVSPSAGNFAPMSLGASPSQFTPPSSHIQVSAGSPGKYGPTSPARGSGVQGSLLGKMAVASQLNRRRNWGYSGSLQSQENGGSRNVPCWRQQRGGNEFTSGYSSAVHNIPESFTVGSNVPFQQIIEAAHDKPESSLSLPDPGNWDPNYSIELLLQEDGLDVSSVSTEFPNKMHLSQALDSSVPMDVGRFNYIFNTSSNISNHRSIQPVQAYPYVEAGSPPSGHGNMHAEYAHPMSKSSNIMPHFSQNSPSRFGQQPVQWFNHGKSTFVRGGRKAGHPIPTIPPTSYARKDYGRIA